MCVGYLFRSQVDPRALTRLPRVSTTESVTTTFRLTRVDLGRFDQPGAVPIRPGDLERPLTRSIGIRP
jgi:hypothetical protein